MAQILADLRRDLQQDIQASKGHTRAVQNTLFEEFNALNEERRTRPPTPMGNAIPNEVPNEVEEGEAYDGWQMGNVRDRVNHMENGHFEREGGGGNGANKRFGGGNVGYGRFGLGNQHGGMDPYGDRFRRDRYYEEEPRPRFDDPSKTLKHNLFEFHGKFDPEAYLE